jgi:hypothetical protein
MKTLHAFIAITATAALTTSPVRAQLLGGGIGGSMSHSFGGALNGSMIDRSGTLDGRFGSDHSVRTGDNFKVAPSLPSTAATERKVDAEKKTAGNAGHAVAGQAESSANTALSGGAAAAHAGSNAASEVKSAALRDAQAEASTSERAVASGKQTADVTGHEIAGQSESSLYSALNSSGSAMADGNGAATDVKSPAASTGSPSSTAPKAQSPPKATSPQTGAGERTAHAPAVQATDDGRAANNTHVSGGTDGWNAGSQTATGADASASVKK